MILDSLATLAESLAVTDTDALTTYSVDLGNITPKGDFGAGEPLALVFMVDVAAAGSTDTTHLVLLQDTAAGLTTAPIRLVDRLIANALLTAGSIWVLPIPPTSTPLRYVGGKVELGSSDTITVSAYILPMSFISKLRTYAAGFSIS